MSVLLVSLFIAWVLLTAAPVLATEWLVIAVWSAALTPVVWLLGGGWWWMLPFSAWSLLMGIVVWMVRD